MRGLYSRGRVLGLVGLLGLLVLVGSTAPAAAGDVTACGDFRSSPDTRFDIKNNITTTGSCLTFGSNVVIYLNGWTIAGPGVSTSTTGITLGHDAFVLGSGIVKQFGTCIDGGDAVAVENAVFNQCGTGIDLGDSYKVKEVRIHDCHPSNFPGHGMILGQGGFVESSIIRSCDIGVETGENNKIWELVVTGHSFHALQVESGNAVSRTVISHPGSSQTRGLIYDCLATAGCQDGSNSVQDHSVNHNISLLGDRAVVVQPTDNPALGATNCAGAPVPKDAAGLILGEC